MLLLAFQILSLYSSCCLGFVSIQLPATVSRQQRPTRLASSLTDKSIPKSTQSAALYQKIVHAPPGTRIPGSWILSLVESLEVDWQLPERLPMPYNKQVDQDSNISLECTAYPQASLRLTVVSVLEHDMCIVMVQANDHHFKAPAMMKSLLDSSQRELFKSLEVFLQDFSMAPLKEQQEYDVQQEQQVQTLHENQQHMIEELYEGNSIIDAEIVQEYSTDKSGIADMGETAEQKRQRVLESMNQPASQAPKLAEDFAVQAARRHAQGNTEFAVQAARKRKITSEPTKKTIASPNVKTVKRKVKSSELQHPVVAEEPTLNLSAIRPPMLDDSITGTQRSFHHSVSRPEEYKPRMGLRNHPKTPLRTRTKDATTPINNKQRSKRANAGVSSAMDAAMKTETAATKENTQENDVKVPDQNKHIPDQQSKAPSSVVDTAVGTASDPVDAVIDAENIQERQKKHSDPIAAAKGRKLNLHALEEREPVMMASTTNQTSDDPAIRYTQEALDEMIEQSQDMTPEELLQDVMNFGKKTELKEKTGRGFVNGALDTAKELLRERKKSKSSPKAATKVKKLTTDEALKEMFQAGERLAEGRITRQEAQQATELQSDDEMVDSLIDSEKAVSRNARVLDDELAELEVMIQRTPGEEYDDVTNASPMFDVLSGPEVYNPNVDPKTAVNWPGALPGTKDVRLPKELDEALKQAKFAANVMMKVEETTRADGKATFKVGDQILSEEQVTNLQSVVNDAVEIGLIDDPVELLAEESRLQMLVDELWTQPGERTREIVSNYKDLLLSEHFVDHVKKRLADMVQRDLDALRNDDTSLEERHQRERDILGQLVSHAQLLLKEARALGAELEASQLEVIRSICKVAMDPSLKTEEETAEALTYAVRDMRPLFDDMFIAYLKYAIAEEEGRLARAGLLDDPAANDWLFVLKIVQQGVYKEISTSINRYLEHIWYVLRMETASERKMLLEELVNVMPTLDVRPFVQVVENIVGALGQSAKGEFDGTTELGEMTNKLLQLYRDVREILPPERIEEKSRDADAWVAKQRQRLMDQRNLTKQRLRASHDTEHLDEEIEAMDANGIGDVDRFD